MRSRGLIVVIAFLAVILWAGLAFYVNQRAPTAANQVVFLSLFGAAIACTAAPVAYAVDSRLSTHLYVTDSLGIAVRRGLLLGILAFVLMAMRFVRLLTPLSGALLTLLALSAELALSLRKK